MTPYGFLTSGAIILLFALVRASYGNYHRVFNSYAKTRVIIDCLGDEMVQEYTTRMRAAVAECKGIKHPSALVPNTKSPPAGVRNFNAPQNPFGTQSFINPVALTMREPFIFNKQNPPFSDFNWEDLFDPSKSITFQNRRIIPVPFTMAQFYPQRFSSFQNFRTKRSSQFMYFPEDEVRSLKNKVVHSISNFTCVLRKMNYANENDQLQYDVLANEIVSSKLHQDLKDDLLKGMNHCTVHATCMPFDKMPSVLGTNLQRVMAFLKCFDKKRFMACMKHDFRSNNNHFSLQGLDGVLQHLQEDDQMLAISWSDITMNQKDFTDIVF